MKIIMSISIIIFSSLGGWIGQIMDHGNWLGGWGIIFGTIGGFIGIWIAFKANQYIDI